MTDHEKLFTDASKRLIEIAEEIMENAPSDFSHEDLCSVYLATTVKMFVARIGITSTATQLKIVADELLVKNTAGCMKKH